MVAVNLEQELKYYIECYNKQKAANERLQARVEQLEGVRGAARRLYLQLHNIQEVRPRWANENVCEAMRNVSEALAATEQQEQDGD